MSLPRIPTLFPTRRSSDLVGGELRFLFGKHSGAMAIEAVLARYRDELVAEGVEISPKDRKSTRLNSSHSQISYAVFCLKKNTKQKLKYLWWRMRKVSSQHR